MRHRIDMSVCHRVRIADIGFESLRGLASVALMACCQRRALRSNESAPKLSVSQVLEALEAMEVAGLL